MYGFRPARNRKHPGDRPPKWAPIGRTGRFVLLGTVIVGIVIALVILTARTAAAADDTGGAATMTGPSSPPVSSQRIEVREAGYAVTFPEDWAVEIVEEDSDTGILRLSGPERFGPDVELRNVLVAWGPGGRGPARDTWNVCTLVRYEPIEFTSDEFLHEIFETSDVAVEALRDGLSRIFMNQFLTGRILTDSPGAIYVEHYAIGGDNAVALLWCTGVLSHREEWLSIAESFEFLPAGE